MKDIQNFSGSVPTVNKYLRISSFLSDHSYDSPAVKVSHKNGIYLNQYTECHLHKNDRNFYDKPPYNRNKNISVCLYDDEEKLNNWKYYVLNNKLPLFLGICMNTGQHNINVIYHTPYITDKKYTDEEIYDKLKFTEEEINLINKTLEKYEYSSEFFKKLRTGE